MILSDDKLKVVLKENKLLDDTAVTELVKVAVKNKTSLYAALLLSNATFEEKLAEVFAKQFNLPLVNLTKSPIPDDVLGIVPERVARSIKVVAFKRDGAGVHLATPEPERVERVMELVSKKTGQKALLYYTTESEIEQAIKGYKRDLQKIIDELIKEEAGRIRPNYLSEAPITKIVDTLIQSAYEDRASDIHIEPQEQNSLIRFRVDGMLNDLFVMDKGLHDRVITRLKVLSNLRTDEHLSAQDGKLRVELPEEKLDIRISILPIVEGEKAVLRLLSSKTGNYTLTDLGMNDRDLKVTNSSFEKSFGMILSTGPTGSGKTTTIYSILKILNQREKNLTTIEDPVEYRINGANQVQVNAKTNLTFANGLRSILRQDPNIIFVGEIRDGETADIAVNAALTGHLVFSTLHTNDAATAIPRLIDMGVEPFLVASTVNVIIAQRLVRKICNSCRISMTITEEELSKKLSPDIVKRHFLPVGEKKEIRIYHGQGCKICQKTGYLGRVGAFEVIEVTQKIRDLITTKSDADAIAKAAKEEGTTSILDDGLDKVARGITTIEEVLRVATTEFL